MLERHDYSGILDMLEHRARLRTFNLVARWLIGLTVVFLSVAIGVAIGMR